MRLPLRLGILGALLFALCGCETTAPTPAATRPATPTGTRVRPAWVSLERSGGSSLLYRVTLYADGAVLFEGAPNSARPGSMGKHIPPAAAAAIFRQLELVSFWEFEPRYDAQRTPQGNDFVITASAPLDAPWDAIIAQNVSRVKRIDGLFYAPRELLDLKAAIEQAVGLAAWLEGGRP